MRLDYFILEPKSLGFKKKDNCCKQIIPKSLMLKEKPRVKPRM